MTVIGLTGPIGHGKSTFATAVADIEPKTKRLESSMVIAEVANALHAATQNIPPRDDIEAINNWLKPLPGILKRTVHAKCTFNQIEIRTGDAELDPLDYEKLLLHMENLGRRPELLKQKITKENKEAYRPILQWLGGYLVKKVDSGIWYKEIVRRAGQMQDQDFEYCLIGGLRFPTDAKYVRSVGGIIIRVYRPGYLQYDKLDPTERERDGIKPDCTIVSNGTIEDIAKLASQVLLDIKNNALHKTYYAVPMS